MPLPNGYTNDIPWQPAGAHRLSQAVEALKVLRSKRDGLGFKELMELEELIDATRYYICELDRLINNKAE